MRTPESAQHKFLHGLARAVGGAVIFALPLMMTMEMWFLGSYVPANRIALMLAASIPLLVGLSHFSGFEETFNFLEDTVDAFVAMAVGFVVAALMLAVFGVVTRAMPLHEVVSRVSLQAIPASLGALLAHSQFGGSEEEDREEEERISSYPSQLFVMAVGALFLAFNIAPTEEVLLIALNLVTWQLLALVALSLLSMHAFVYAARFSGQEKTAEGIPEWSVFLRFTVAGFAIALLMCAYVLWTFGRLEGVDPSESVALTLVLGFPAAIGAAAARLIL